VHNVFHISQLKKCLRVPEEQLPLEELDVQDDLTYTEHPIKILDTTERITWSKRIQMCRVQWSHHAEDEATWEERTSYTQNFLNSLLAQPNLEDEVPFKGGRFVTP
jgi:hypothetical protein